MRFQCPQAREFKVGRGIATITACMDGMTYESPDNQSIFRWITVGVNKRVKGLFVISYLGHTDLIDLTPQTQAQLRQAQAAEPGDSGRKRGSIVDACMLVGVVIIFLFLFGNFASRSRVDRIEIGEQSLTAQ